MTSVASRTTRESPNGFNQAPCHTDCCSGDQADDAARNDVVNEGRAISGCVRVGERADPPKSFPNHNSANETSEKSKDKSTGKRHRLWMGFAHSWALG